MTENSTDMTVTTLSPQQAADRASVSRGTIMNAIKDKSLTAFRDNRNRWQITADNLSEWMTGRGVIITATATDKPDNVTPPIDERSLQIAVLEAEARAKDERIADLETDRDHWRDQAKALANAPRRKWWQRG